MADAVKITVRVKPGAARARVGVVQPRSPSEYCDNPQAARARVGGSYGDAGALVVAVTERAVDGKATEAALKAVAKALGVPRSAVTLLHGATSREKVLLVQGEAAQLGARVDALKG